MNTKSEANPVRTRTTTTQEANNAGTNTNGVGKKSRPDTDAPDAPRTLGIFFHFIVFLLNVYIQLDCMYGYGKPQRLQMANTAQGHHVTAKVTTLRRN